MIFEKKEILKALVVKNFKGPYKSSRLGFLWQFLTPFISIILFYVMFTSLRVMDIPNYWYYLCVGMFPFTFLNSMINGGMCLVNNASLIKKIAFPKSIITISYVISNFITFLISFTITIVLSLCAGCPPDGRLLLLTMPLMLMMFLAGLGTTLLLSAIVVYVRDLAHLITAITRILFWVTPVFYSVHSLTGLVAEAIWLNPLTYFVVSFQNLMYYGTLDGTILLACLGIALAIFFIGIAIFIKLERRIAEVI